MPKKLKSDYVEMPLYYEVERICRNRIVLNTKTTPIFALNRVAYGELMKAFPEYDWTCCDMDKHFQNANDIEVWHAYYKNYPVIVIIKGNDKRVFKPDMLYTTKETQRVAQCL